MSIILDVFSIYYENLDAQLRILPQNEQFWSFLNEKKPLEPCPLENVFPEIIGSEGWIESILSAGKGQFQLSSILHDEQYIHLTIIPGDEQGKGLVVIKDNTEEAKKQQQAIQQRNEVFLLKQDIETKNKELLESNRELIALLNKMREQEMEMRSKVNFRTHGIRKALYAFMLMQGKTAEFRDQDSGGHVYRVSRIASILGKGYGLPPAECEKLFFACLLHDIGKAAVPREILFKPGPLAEKEWDVMKKSLKKGVSLLPPGDSPLFSSVSNVALCHYEHWDGSGYPEGLKGEDIPLFGRLCAVAEVFDVLLSKRPYKEPIPLDQAVGTMLHGSGNHFDPSVIKVFQNVLNDITSICETISRDEDGSLPEF